MQAAAFIYQDAKGNLGAVLGQKLDPLVEQAKRARVTGKVGKVTVDRGVVLASWRTFPAYDFIAEKPVESQAPEM